MGEILYKHYTCIINIPGYTLHIVVNAHFTCTMCTHTLQTKVLHAIHTRTYTTLSCVHPLPTLSCVHPLPTHIRVHMLTYIRVHMLTHMHATIQEF